MIIQILLGIIIVLLVTILIGVSLYDIREIRKQQLYKQHPFKKQFRHRPFISIIVTATGAKNSDLERCLDSIIADRYRKREIIIVSTTRHNVVKKILSRYENIALYTSKRSVDIAVRSAYQRYGEGELIMQIDDTCFIDSQTCTKLVWQYNAENQPDAMLLRSRVVSAFSMIGLFEFYSDILRNLVRKTRSVFDNIMLSSRRYVIFSKNAFVKKAIVSVFYSAESGIHTSSTGSLPTFMTDKNTSKHPHSVKYWLLTMPLTIFTIILPVSLSYFGYIAVGLHQPSLLLICIATVTLFLLLGIWWDDSLSLGQKVRYSLLAPITYIPFYIISWIQFIRVLINPFIKQRV